MAFAIRLTNIDFALSFPFHAIMRQFTQGGKCFVLRKTIQLLQGKIDKFLHAAFGVGNTARGGHALHDGR